MSTTTKIFLTFGMVTIVSVSPQWEIMSGNIPLWQQLLLSPQERENIAAKYSTIGNITEKFPKKGRKGAKRP